MLIKASSLSSFIIHLLLLPSLSSWLSSNLINAEERVPLRQSRRLRESDGGQRIVDAARIQERYSFLVVFNFVPAAFAKCTGSLVTAKHVITAAHCLGPKKEIGVDNCGKDLEPRIKLECSLTEEDDLRIDVKERGENAPQVLIGISSVHEDRTNPHAVHHIIRPRHSYPGGSYGTYGGYDLLLLTLAKKVAKFPPICLPSSKEFDDLGKAIIAGYGRFKRPPCETGARGPHKFEFCGVEPDCTKGSEKHDAADCDVVFRMGEKEVRGCQHTETPSAQNEECQHFLAATKFEFDETIDEIVITNDREDEILATCYRTEPGSFGWCGTIHNFTGFEKQHLLVSAEDGWGFCQRSCYPSPKEALGGVERHKVVDIVSEEYCHLNLMSMVPSGSNFEIEPQLLCVAYNHSFKSDFYAKTNENYEKIDLEPSKRRALHQLMGRSLDWYIVGTGSCSGDSGGPLFKKTNDESYVLVGVTSRGTGVRGNCGGLDNPTHFVRIKLFLHWIKTCALY